MVFVEGTYSPERLRRNRLAVLALGGGGAAACLLISSATDWALLNALGIAGVWLAFCLALWWLFCSRTAGPIGLSAQSKGWFGSVAAPYRRRISTKQRRKDHPPNG